MATKKRTAATRTMTETVTMPQGSAMPKLLILGRGQLHGRRLHAIRIKPEVLARLAEVASGPMYLLVEVAVNRLVAGLHETEAIEVLRAEDLT